MRKVLFFLGAILSCLLSHGQGTITTYPPLVNNNGSSGITFEIESTQPIVINDIKNLFNSGSLSVELWYRIGGVQHISGSAPNVSSANGWVQHFTGTVSGNGSTPVSIASMNNLTIPANTRVGIAILGGTSYQTWTSTSQDVFTDGTVTVYTGQNIGYGGGNPSWPNHPREFLGSVSYDLDIVGDCSPFTNFTVDSITPYAFKVDWTPGSSSSSFYLEYGLSGFTPGSSAGTKITGTYPSSTQPPVIITGLSQYTDYDLYFGEICNSGADSTYFPSPRKVTTAPVCPPLDSITILSVDSASITFTYWGGTTDSILYLFGPTGFNQASSSSNGYSYNDTVTIPNLSSSTDYDLKLISDCSKRGDGISDTLGPISFHTECPYVHVPYVQDFDGVSSGLPNCWKDYYSPNSSYPSITTTTGGSPVSGGHQLYMYNSGLSSSDNMYAISPAIWGLDNQDKQVRFAAKTTSSGTVTLVVGTITDLNDPGNFHPVDTIRLSNKNKEYVVKLDAASNYNGTDKYVALKHGNNTTYTYIYLDDFTVEAIPACAPTGRFNFFGNAGGSTTLLYWIPGDGSTWDIEYGSQGFTPGSGTTVSALDTFKIITGLTPNTSYDFYLSDNCGSTGSSRKIGPLTFLTGCGSPANVSTLPFFEGFESYSGSVIGDTNFCNSDYSFELRTASGEGRLRFNAGSGFYKNGAAAATLDRSIYGDLNTNYLTFTFDLSTNTSAGGIILGFSYAHHGQEMHPEDRVWVRGSTSDPWLVLYDLDANQSSSTGTFVDVANLNIIPTLTNGGQSISSTTQIRFGQTGGSLAYATSYSDGYTFDDISLEAVQCPPVSGLSVSALVDTSATLNWLGTGTSSSYGVWFGPQGFYQGSMTVSTAGHMTNSSAPGLVVDTLMPNNCYEFVVRSYCTNGDTSDWIGPFQFCTPCSPFSAPYFQGFEAANTSEMPDCWASVIRGINQYNYVYVTTSSPNTGAQNLYMYNSGNDTTMAISAPLDGMPANDKRVKFSARLSSGTGESLIVGTVSSQDNPESFDPVDTFSLSSNYQMYFADLTTANGYNGTDGYVALLHGNNITYQTIYIDDFTYEVIPSCPEPFGGFTDNITPATADIHWTAGGNATYSNIDFGPVGFTPSASSSNYQSVSSTSASLSGLTGNTTYEWYVRDSCGAGDVSIWSGPYTFTTLCNLSSAPYYTGFETSSLNQMPDCWQGVEIGSSSQYNYIYVSQSNSFRGTQQLYLYNSSNDTTIAVMPGFSDLTAGNKRIRFYAKTTSSLSSIIVGTVSAPDAPGSFVPIDTVQVSGAYQKLKVNFTTNDGYNGTDQYIALMHGDNATYQTIYIDEMHYEVIPSCDESDMGKSFNIQSNGASLTWTPSGSATHWNIAYGPVGFTPSTSAPGYVSVSNDTATLSGLTDATTYEWYVQDSCGVGSVSIWEGPYTFTTLCLPFTAPYTEDFENSVIGTYTGRDNCWHYEANNPAATSSTSTYSWEVRNTVQTTSSGTGPDRDNTLAPAIGGTFVTADVSYGSTGDTALLSSPLVDISGLSNPELQFYFHMYGSNMASLHLDINDGNGWDRDVITLSQQYNSSASDPYKDTIVSLSSYANSTSLQVRFRLISAGCCAGDVAIDDIRISDPITCAEPSSFVQTSSGPGSATVSWDTTGLGGSTFDIEYGPRGFSHGAGTVVNSTSNSLIITGLPMNNLCYDAYVRAHCSANDSSLWKGPISICPDEIICTDSLEAYSPGYIDGQSALFIAWGKTDAGDGEVSTTQANSGSQSLHIYDSGPAGFSDVVAYFDTISTGAWKIDFKYYIPSGKAAYYNIQYGHDISGGGNHLFGGEVYFQDNGTALVQYGSGTNVGTFSYSHNQWIDISTIIDLTNDTIWIETNGVSTGLGWQYSISNLGVSPQFNGIDFYSGVVSSSGETADFYMDDFCVSPYTPSGCIPPSSLAVANIGCDSAEISWTSTKAGSSILEYGPSGYSRGSGTSVGFVNSPYVINGLMASTAYDFYVADTCGNDTSSYAGPVSFSTNSAPMAQASFTYTSSYTASTQSITFDGSGSSNADSYSWDFGNGNTGTGVNPPAETYNLPNAAVSVKLTVTNNCGSTDDTTVVINTNIGVIEPDFARSLAIYPNPSSGIFNIEFNRPEGNKLRIEVINVAGQVVYRKDLSQAGDVYKGQINLGDHAKGVYTLRISSDSGIVIRRLNRM